MNNQNIKNFLLQLLRFDTSNDGHLQTGRTLELLQFIKKEINSPDIEVNIQPYSVKLKNGQELKGRGNLIALPKGRSRGPFIMLQGHVDTVGDATGFKPGARQGYIHGRGAVDMKGSVAVMIRVFKQLIKKKNLKYQPMLVLTSDEEANDFSGIKEFLKTKHSKKEIAFAVCGEPTSLEIKTKLMGVLNVEVNIRQAGGHGALPQKENVIEKAGLILSELIKIKKLIVKQKRAGFDPATMNIGVIRGGDVVNKIPRSCVIKFAVRTIQPHSYYKKIIEKRIALLGFKNIKIKYCFSYDPVIVRRRLPSDGLGSKIKKGRGIFRAFSEATLLNQNDILAYVFGAGDIKKAHKKAEKESISLAELEKYEKILVGFFRND
ncbi:M20/M25/M40 family metallo-hydrolase [Patescibacteria group bacterium]|nr:M20/M25/M40 family metallo-hydrolase [Patescibacteria group bacterium]MBU4511818.1 M20/M25/M40 family metallo-hydrolase [Patescibacteria group bacterium]MCG2692767.1 M20/M25/M40 family metallo-hydrolase [Candidatus Parcubacteria bacterium]